MSFEDIEMAQAARAAKEVIKGKGKRGRKRKSAALEADEPETEAEEAEPELEVARAAKDTINGRGKRGRKCKSAAQEAEEPEPEVAWMIDAPVPWRAPVARMICETVAQKNTVENRFSFQLIRIWFLEAGNRIQLMFVAFSAQ
jgi:hypothetical protein